jgi:putative intracellular protease/amidase
VAGFSNTEEVAVGKDKAVPFLLEDRIKELGADYKKDGDWTPFAVASGKLVTGQNPQSSKKVAELVAGILQGGLKEPVHGKGEHAGFHHR